MELSKTVEIHVELLDEGVDTWRPTQAEPLGNKIFKILPTSDYDPEDETWEFLPGSIVRCEMKKTDDGDEVLLAVEQVNDPKTVT